MCILCVASRWSRRIVTMLPWLVIPLIILWALSQLLPPGFQFEVTSPRLACVAVLLVSLGWYEIVMPRLSSWRAKRRAMLRERRRIELQEVAKWRKEATRRCRNCLTAYKDQTPGGGRFMCTYCGHVSKRPVLDVPGASTAGTAASPFSMTGSTGGLINGVGIFASRSSRVWSGRLPDRPILGGGRGWIGSRSWATDSGGWSLNGSWFGGPWPSSSSYFGIAGTTWAGTGTSIGGVLSGGERCSAGESYSGVFFLVLRIFSALLSVCGWIWKKLCRAGCTGDDGLMGSHRHCRGEDAGPSPATRSERARRKAEEKRQARLEKEQLEAEERKQREEVARLVEERRRQRDEKLEAEKESEREAAAEREREIRREREAERRHQEKAREREKVQGKDKPKDQEVDELKRRKGKETEKERSEDVRNSPISGSDHVEVMKPQKDAKATDTAVKGGPTKGGSSKYTGSAKAGFFSHKNGALFWGRNFSAGSSSAAKSSKPAALGSSSPASCSNSSSESSAKSAEGSRSAWNRLPWTNVWSKATDNVSDNTSKQKTETVSENKVETTGSGSAKELVDGTIISTAAVGGSGTIGAALQPIAPPSCVSDSWDNVFSSPLCFPPIELPMDSRVYKEERQTQMAHEVIQKSIASSSLSCSQSFFESSPAVGFPYTEVSKSSAPLVETSPIPSAVSSSIDMIDFGGMDVADPLSLLGPVTDSLMSNETVSSSAIADSLSPIMPPFPAMTHISPASTPVAEVPEHMNTGIRDLPQILEPWSVPPLSLDSTKDVMGEGIWRLWGASHVRHSNFQNASPWGDFLKQDGDSLQPLPENFMHLFEPASQLPSSLFQSGQIHEGLTSNHGEPLPGASLQSNNFWSEPSALDSTMRIWDDADLHQKVPPDFIDCITHSLMQDPVITADGHSYERSAIEAWLKSHDTSPKTGEVLPPPPGSNGIGVDKTLRPNHILRGQIIEYRERLARRLGSQQGAQNSRWSNLNAGLSNSSWSSASNSPIRPNIRGLYPTPGVESVWSYNG